MKDQVRVTLGQIDVDSLEPERNLERIEAMCRRAAADGADLIVLPELADLGQVPSFDPEFAARFFAAVKPLDTNPVLRTVRELAKETGMHVVMGVAEAHGTVSGTVFNTAVVIGPDGRVLGAQRKLHLPGEERHYFGVGDRIQVVPTELGVLSAQICYDLYFPEVARVAALQGAEIFIGVANIPHRTTWPDRLANLAAVRAYENMQYVVLVNRIGTNHGTEFGGESVVASPPGNTVERCPAQIEASLTTTLTAELIQRERARRPVFADRRPDVYAAIADPTIPPHEGEGHGN